MSAKQEKPCPACNGTGTVVNLGVPEECPMCDDDGNTETTGASTPRRQAQFKRFLLRRLMDANGRFI